MPRHAIEINRTDKKGKPVVQYIQPVRYIDLTNGIIYVRQEDGKLVDRHGVVYGENKVTLDSSIEDKYKFTKTEEKAREDSRGRDE